MERFIRLLVRRDFVVWWGKARGCADEDESNKGTFELSGQYSTVGGKDSKHHHLLLAHSCCREKGNEARRLCDIRGYVPAKGLRIRMVSCRNVL